MPHLPTTAAERREADRERRATRIQMDQRFDLLRTRPARVVLAVCATASCLAIAPAFIRYGTVSGVAVVAVCWALWGALRMSVRAVPDLADRFLDERQRAVKNRLYVWAYLILGWTIAGGATIALMSFVAVSPDGATLTVPLTWNVSVGLVLFITTFISVLPYIVVSMMERGERLEPITSLDASGDGA